MVPHDMHDMSGKVVLITGASRGLGRQMARGLAAAGAEVIVSSRKVEACEEVVAELNEDFGAKASAIAAHVGRWDDIDRLVSEAYEKHGRIDVLINNAGLSPLYDVESNITEELYDKVLAINLKGPFRLCALIGERMAADGRGGSIINVSSMAAVSPQPHAMPYSTAKAGLNHITLAYARVLGPTVRVNAIMCGPFFTDISEHWDMDYFNAQVQRHALRRGGQPEEVIGTALYLASDASSFTTGAVIPVSGGQP
jgi:NAD(P)-dependent dehydrogenase (short-subunit alcohol dehydrogenase family)